MQSSLFLLCFAGLAATLDAAWTVMIYWLSEFTIKRASEHLNADSDMILLDFMKRNSYGAVFLRGVWKTFVLYSFLEVFVWYTN